MSNLGQSYLKYYLKITLGSESFVERIKFIILLFVKSYLYPDHGFLNDIAQTLANKLTSKTTNFNPKTCASPRTIFFSLQASKIQCTKSNFFKVTQGSKDNFRFIIIALNYSIFSGIFLSTSMKPCVKRYESLFRFF